MGAEVIRTELRLSGDRRVRAGLRGAIEHVAGRHGLSAAEQREFAEQVDRECGKAIEPGGPGALCDVLIEEQEDRMEVKVRHVGPDSKSTKLHAATSAKDAELRRRDNGSSGVTLLRHFHRSATRS